MRVYIKALYIKNKQKYFKSSCTMRISLKLSFSVLIKLRISISFLLNKAKKRNDIFESIISFWLA